VKDGSAKRNAYAVMALAESTIRRPNGRKGGVLMAGKIKCEKCGKELDTILVHKEDEEYEYSETEGVYEPMSNCPEQAEIVCPECKGGLDGWWFDNDANISKIDEGGDTDAKKQTG
jgi:hypothetical protein